MAVIGSHIKRVIFNTVVIYNLFRSHPLRSGRRKYPDRSFSVFEDLRGFGNLAGLMSDHT
jgi:hypothetical protein